MGTNAKSDGGQTLWIILPLSYKRIINITVWCLTDCSCTYSVQHNVYIKCVSMQYAYMQFEILVAADKIWQCVVEEPPDSVFFSSQTTILPQPYRIALQLFCVFTFAEFFLFSSTAEIVITIQFNFYFLFLFSLCSSVCRSTVWNSHCENHVINRCVRMIESSSVCSLFSF